MSERKVSTDALETLGQIIDDTQKRDAIHLAVLPAIAAERLFAGQDIGITDHGASTKAEHLGIVDPFLKGPVQKGERFWFVLYPRMVTSLRHVWSHPAFIDEAGTGASSGGGVVAGVYAARAALQRVADEAGLPLEELLDGARNFLRRGEYLMQGGRWEGFSIPDDFWSNYELATNEAVAERDRSNFFSCTC